MVKMYRGAAECTADRDQVADMEHAGWSVNKPVDEPEVEAPKVEEPKPAPIVVGQEAVPTKDAPKKTALKKRRNVKKAE